MKTIPAQITKIINMLELYDCEIVSYGLAPNPNGFCFEASESTTQDQVKALSKALDQLTSKEEQFLKNLIFGGYHV